jgi:hypothetical protein
MFEHFCFDMIRHQSFVNKIQMILSLKTNEEAVLQCVLQDVLQGVLQALKNFKLNVTHQCLQSSNLFV